jgi:hypothetical protein
LRSRCRCQSGSEDQGPCHRLILPVRNRPTRSTRPRDLTRALVLWGSIPMLFCRTIMLIVPVLVLCLGTGQWSRTFRDLAILVKRIAFLAYVFGGRHWLGRHEVNSTVASKHEGTLAGCSQTWTWMCFVCGDLMAYNASSRWSDLFADMLNYTCKDRSLWPPRAP